MGGTDASAVATLRHAERMWVSCIVDVGWDGGDGVVGKLQDGR